MRPLCSGEGSRRANGVGRESRLHLDLQALTCEQLHARPTMKPPAPISPEEGSRTDEEWMQHDTHPTRLGGGCAMPLTLFAQETGAATAHARCIDHTQAPVGFSAPLLRNK